MNKECHEDVLNVENSILLGKIYFLCFFQRKKMRGKRFGGKGKGKGEF